ncbi:MAG TPA: adenylate/guanylate cyclase domain-containing protein [Candidatus Sulfotelmatobacter sp.]|nr:adenylate/guanylate cyclase domain-containing protein [Candidatus Sulfotelmatobacter sp.]
MTGVMTFAAGSFATVATVAVAGGRALGAGRERWEAAALAAGGTVLALTDISGVFAGVALVLGLSGAARLAESLLRARRERSIRLVAALEREGVARGRFLPRTLVERLGRASLAEVSLGDRATHPMTVVFADIRDSTALTESLDSEAAFVLIADFFARSARVVRRHHGSIDRYLGDGYMALFPRCVEDALDTALALQDAVAQLNAERLGPPIEIGIGVHTGPVTFGTVGDALHLDATVVSDTVNTAKRVEGISKQLAVPIVATEDVVQAVRDPDQYLVHALGTQQLRGKNEPIDVFAISAAPIARVATVRETVPAKPAG